VDSSVLPRAKRSHVVLTVNATNNLLQPIGPCIQGPALFRQDTVIVYQTPKPGLPPVAAPGHVMRKTGVDEAGETGIQGDKIMQITVAGTELIDT